MQPFMAERKQPQIMVNDQTQKPEPDNPDLHMAAQDVLRAIESKNHVHLARALEAAHYAIGGYTRIDSGEKV